MARKVYFWLLFLFFFSSIRFFRPIFVTDDLLKFIYYAFILILFLITSLRTNNYSSFDNFKPVINTFLINIGISILSAGIIWGQSFIDTFISSIPFLSVILYFFLHNYKISPYSLERIFTILTIIYAICFFIALIIYPNKLFLGYGEIEKAIDTSRGFPRIRLTLMGGAPIFFSFFYFLSNFKIKKDNYSLIFLLINVVLIVLQLGRVPIIASFLLGVFFYVDKYSFINKLVFSFILVFVLYLLYENIPILKSLVEYSLNDYDNSIEEENIRTLAYKFYFNVSNNWFSVFFGNGQYSLGKSDFGNFIDRFGRTNGLIPADVGYAYIYLNFGIFGLLIFSYLLIKSLMLKINNRFTYVKYYISFIFLVNFTGNTVLGSLPFLIMSLYLLDCGNYISKIKSNE